MEIEECMYQKVPIFQTPKFCIVFTNEYARVEPVLSTYNFISKRNIINSFKSILTKPELTIEKIIFEILLHSMRSLSNIISSFEEEVHAIHSSSFNVAYSDRHIHN